HELLLQEARAAADRVTVAVGSTTEPLSLRNPWSFEERRAMVYAVLPEARVIGVPDLHDPPRWVPHLLRLTGSFDVAFGNDQGTTGLLELAGFAVRRPGLHDRAHYEATRIREQMRGGDPAWREAVPAPVAALLESWRSAERLRGLA
ncbi:MAG TPA: hypothetical protein VFH47_07750, partial [Candidatus Thermoplasmatota archaeon]|nr:hypothetical protein [Candidatus Thermoplasmatota archaeon]